MYIKDRKGMYLIFRTCTLYCQIPLKEYLDIFFILSVKIMCMIVRNIIIGFERIIEM